MFLNFFIIYYYALLHPALMSNVFKKVFKLNDPFEKKYAVFAEDEILRLKNVTKEMFYFGYENYLKYAFPLDELDPIHCSGRGPDYDNSVNLNINDVLGDYCLTLVDSLSTLAIFGDIEKFKEAVTLIINNVSFDKNTTIQVFEANIRVLGSLLSAHLLIADKEKPFGNLKPSWYDRELLDLAADLASRLMSAFSGTKTGLPHPRVNLRDGVPRKSRTDTCTAGAGSLLIEFGLLSKILEDPVYELAARRANNILWHYRDTKTGLFGNVIDVMSGEWLGSMSGIGAGSDSFFEYMLKAFILFGNPSDLSKFTQAYQSIKKYLRRGRKECNFGQESHPLYVNVDMTNGKTFSTWIDSLQASFSGIQVLAGDVEEAICSHAVYFMIWKKFGVLPERFNWDSKEPQIAFYPLRPEFAESTYLLYQATGNPFYLHVGREIVESINKIARVKCGFATVHSVIDGSLEDRMESFFLSETCKYLYLLFDLENPVNTDSSQYLFTTEGHVIKIESWMRKHDYWSHNLDSSAESASVKELNIKYNVSSGTSCSSENRRFGLPLESKYWHQLSTMFKLEL